MSPSLTGISSMATRQVLAELTAAYETQTGQRVAIEAVGGVDAARRVQAGEGFDFVVLAADALQRLIDGGRAVAGSRVDLVRSPIAIAVRAAAPRPDVSTEDAVRRALLAARSIGYSTGPSGAHLVQLFERWGLAELLRQRTVQAPPGVPVGALVARGEVELGFQQLSELLHLEGVTVLGTLPAAIAHITTFSAAVCAGAAQADAARELLAFMAAPTAAAAAAKRRHGMEPA